jgi:hypothetical protein
VEGAGDAMERPCVGVERVCVGVGSWVGYGVNSGHGGWGAMERVCVRMGELIHYLTKKNVTSLICT